MKMISVVIGAGLTATAIAFSGPSFASTGMAFEKTDQLTSTVERRGQAEPRDDRGGTRPRPRPADRPGDDRVDNGSGIMIAKGKGRTHPEDNGTDAPDGCDDHGIDGACHGAGKA